VRLGQEVGLAWDRRKRRSSAFSDSWKEYHGGPSG
jgi:hypothetical protein